MRDDAEAVLVRLVDDRGVELGRGFFTAPCDRRPDLDDVDLLRRILLHRLARFRRGRHPVRLGRAPRFRRRDAAPGGEESRKARRGLGANLIRHVGRVLTKAHRRADAEVRAPPQVVDERLARLAQMRVRVDNRRHHGLAGQVDAHRARGHAHVGRPADLREARAVRRTTRSRSARPSPTTTRAP